MRSSQWVLAVTVALAGACTGAADPEPVLFTIEVGVPLGFPNSTETDYVDDIKIDFELVDSPDGSSLNDRTRGLFDSDGRTIFFTADIRGRFVIDRFISIGASDRWTHRYYLDATNAPPHAVIEGPERGNVGVPAEFDGLASFDTETTDLEYYWRLSERPTDSVLVLDQATEPTVTLEPDAPGFYTIELGVFDGEMWEAEKTAFTYRANLPPPQ